MRLKIDITKDDKYYYFNDNKIKIEILEKEINSDRVRFMIDNGLVLLVQNNEPKIDEYGNSHYEDIVAQVYEIDLENGYISIKDDSIRDKYVKQLRKIKEAEVHPISVDMYGYTNPNILSIKLSDFLLIGFRLNGGI